MAFGRCIAGIATLGAFAIVGALIAPAQAQNADWPTKPLRVVIAGTPGSSSDQFVRAIEPHLQKQLGQTLWVDARPGAGGMVAAEIVARAAPDGYTVFVSNVATNGIGVSLFKRVPFDPGKDLPAVARIATLPNALAVRADSGIDSVADLIAYIRANPKEGNYGSAGVGTTAHLAGVLFGQRTRLELTHVPYKGTAANLAGLLGGEVLFSFNNLPLYVPQVNAGKLRLLAITAAERSALFQEVPTAKESGLPDFELQSWFGLSFATGTPRPIIERLGAAVVASLQDSEVRKRIEQLGAEPAPLGPSDYDAFIRAEAAKWAPIVSASGAKTE